MPAKILIAPDSFKECIDSISLSSLIQSKLKENKYSELVLEPISDGGDAFLKVCENNFQLEEIEYSISTPFDESLMLCKVGYDRINKTIYIESANVLGLKVIPLEKQKPLKLSSKGLGELILKIKADVQSEKLSCDKIYIGIGGTGTVDLGLGMCSIFSMKLFDFYNKELKVQPEDYFRIGEISLPEINLPFQILAIVDVQNRLLGEEGAVRKFAVQKGASVSDMNILDLGFKKVLNVLQKENIITNAEYLSGAGGGIAAALQIFFNSKTISAKDFILSSLNLKNKIDKADIIITGEGRFDSQSLLGKGAFSITEYALQKNKKVFFICGSCENSLHQMENNNFTIIELVDFFDSTAQSIQNIDQGIYHACDMINSKL